MNFSLKIFHFYFYALVIYLFFNVFVIVQGSFLGINIFKIQMLCSLDTHEQTSRSSHKDNYPDFIESLLRYAISSVDLEGVMRILRLPDLPSPPQGEDQWDDVDI